MAASYPYRDINVHSSPSQYAFSSPSNPSAPTLVVDRPSGDLRLHDGKLLGTQRVLGIAGILGIISLRLDKYIIVITKAHPVGKLKGNQIYQVDSTELLPLRERQLRDQDEDVYVTLVKNVLKAAPMFFSYTLDVTNSFQRLAATDPSAPLWKRADDRFFWNRFISSDLIDFRLGINNRFGLRGGDHPGVDPFILPVMMGMLQIRNTSVKGNPFTLALITRRSRYRVGTRYFSRGIDEAGHVSNFNESEQIVILNSSDSIGTTSYGSAGAQNGSVSQKEAQVLSYVQTRGSVPVYWAELNTLHYTPTLQVRGVETAVLAAQKHFHEQIMLYGDNYLVNLVNQKGRELRIKEAYEQMIRILVTSPQKDQVADRRSREAITVIESDQQQASNNEFNRLHYVYFDFHNETKGLQWHRAQILLSQLEQPILHGGYFRAIELPASRSEGLEVRSAQAAVVRTNCMDCLDRTNVVQSMIGRTVLTMQLRDSGVLGAGEQCADDAAFELVFRALWADNADAVSRAYSGTGALKTDFTRLGVRTRRGAWDDFRNSVMRYVGNNFADGRRQDAFDVFLGAYRPADRNLLGRIFVDRRPLVVQAMPYVLAACLFLMLVGSFSRRGDDGSSVWPLRLLMVASFALAAASAYFIWTHGTLYVSFGLCFLMLIARVRVLICEIGQLAKAQYSTLGY